MIYQHPLAYLLGIEGLALLRAWAGDYDDEAEDDVARGLEWAQRAAATDDYFDVHCWAFTPAVFVAVLPSVVIYGAMALYAMR